MQGPIATVGSMHVCPMLNPGTPPPPHVGGPVSVSGAPGVTLNGKPIALMGDMCTCIGPPDMIAQGNPGVTVNGIPVATLGCLTAHGGTITTGEPGITIISTAPSPENMPTNDIPFPSITPILKTLASVTGRRAQLNEAIENQQALREETQGDPLIYNLTWVKENIIIRESRIVKEITLRAKVRNIPDGETISFKVKRENLNNTGENTEQNDEELVELSGTVQDKMVEVIWEMEDPTTNNDTATDNNTES